MSYSILIMLEHILRNLEVFSVFFLPCVITKSYPKIIYYCIVNAKWQFMLAINSRRRYSGRQWLIGLFIFFYQ